MAAALWDEVPTLDFSAFAPHAAVGGAPSAAQLATARRIDEVCRVHGFCKLRNVGLSAAQVDGAFGAARELFALPAEHKRTQLAQHDKQTGTNRGYFAVRPLRRASPRCCCAARAVRARRRADAACISPTQRR